MPQVLQLLPCALLLSTLACDGAPGSLALSAASVLPREGLAPLLPSAIDPGESTAPSATPAEALPSPPKRCAPPQAKTARGPVFRMPSPIAGGAMSNDGCRLAVWNASGELVLIDVEADALLARLRPGPNEAPAAFIDDRRIAFCGDDQNLQLWDGRRAPVPIAKLGGSTPGAACRALLVDPSAKRLAVVANDGPTPRGRIDLVRKEPGSWGGLSATVSIYDLDGHLLGQRSSVGAVEPAFVGGWFTSVHYAPLDPVRSFYDWTNDAVDPTRKWPAGVVFPRLGPGPFAFERDEVARLVSFDEAAKPPVLPTKRGTPYVGAISSRGVAALAYASSRAKAAGISLFDPSFSTEIAFIPDAAAEHLVWTADGATFVALERESARFYGSNGRALGTIEVGVPPLSF